MSVHDESQTRTAIVKPELNFFICAGNDDLCRQFPSKILSQSATAAMGLCRRGPRMRLRICADCESLPPLHSTAAGRCWTRRAPRAAQPVGPAAQRWRSTSCSSARRALLRGAPQRTQLQIFGSAS